MSQVRIWNFGDTLTHTKIATVNEKLFSPGIYEGYDVRVVDQQTIELTNALDPTGNAGYILLPDGIILSETDPIRFEFTVLPALPTSFTIVARHTDTNQFGGAAATYELLDGYVPQGGVSNGTIIAWMYHPGAGAPLDAYMFIQPPKMQAIPFEGFIRDHAPDVIRGVDPSFVSVNDVHHVVSVATTGLSPLQLGSDWICRQVFADGGTPAPAPTTRLLYQFQTRAKPSSIDVIAYIDTGCELRIAAFDVENVQANSTPNSFTPVPVPEWQKLTITIPPYTFVAPDYIANGVWTRDMFWRMELQFDVAQLRTCKVAQVVVHY